ncbi:MAG: ABC transporter permease [Candidatus Riflebacteria bacterium]|nr:ABC transporter permease [Candidatus Riflebacteria bacterium]
MPGIDPSLLLSVLQRSLVAGTPLLLGTLGEICTQRAGVMNLGIEGMMAVGAVSGFAVAFQTQNPWLGLLAAMAAGALLALLHAFVSITLRANQVVSGLALTSLGLGLSMLIGKGFIGQPLAARFEPRPVPGLADLPVVGPLLFQRDPLFYLAVGLGVALWGLLFHTRWGIALRSVGENPLAAETLGVDVTRVRYLATTFGGMLAGMGGAYLSLAYSPSWIEGMTAGRGWIVVALTIFSLWNPLRAFLGAFLFGGIDVAQFTLQTYGISPQLLKTLPYLATLGALWFSSSLTARRRVGAPAALGLPYDKGTR